jgi:hypothetical protein
MISPQFLIGICLKRFRHSKVLATKFSEIGVLRERPAYSMRLETEQTGGPLASRRVVRPIGSLEALPAHHGLRLSLGFMKWLPLTLFLAMPMGGQLHCLRAKS